MRCLFIVVRNLGYSSHFNTLLYETYDTLRLDIPREDLALQSSALVHIMCTVDRTIPVIRVSMEEGRFYKHIASARAPLIYD